ncbi:YtxH domain-containing protein [Flavobacterium agrisoli]|uniref:YtxH domain-containing protein n=1 Tax=Flavobacterium agrisoli TaxID=2793066 RepID=A0A934PQG2_9FLAO|nr:YtxH domain-containing protein [Flavobacterium agrisoli]MBK0370716.1 YtxH domain-containing protein [Flavobacterium agrisoli]
MAKNEKILYESLTSYFKYLVSITIGAITILGAFAGYLFYSNGQEMREDLRLQKAELKENVEEMKTTLAEQKKNFEVQKTDIKEQLILLSQRVNSEINETSSAAIKEVSNIKVVASSLAESEAKKKINEVFDNKNFDQFVEKIAKDRMEPQINNLVDKKIAINETIQINNSLINLSSNDKVKSINASNYLQSNSQIKLSNSQISKIVSDMDKVDLSTRNNMIFAIILRKSQASTEFFTRELGNSATNTLNETYCFQYFLYNDIDYNIFSDAMYKAMLKKTEGYNTYYSSILISKDQNKRFALNLLNDKKLVDLYLKLLPESYRDILTSTFLEDLSQVFNRKDILETVLFKTLKDITKNKSSH